MMGGGAFALLKSGRAGPEIMKQAEFRLANLLKSLKIPDPEQDRLANFGKETWKGCI
jgi:hypothetical protein